MQFSLSVDITKTPYLQLLHHAVTHTMIALVLGYMYLAIGGAILEIVRSEPHLGSG